MIIISGATRGIGLATAKLAVELGARVTIGSRSEAMCNEVADELNGSAGHEVAMACAFDLGDSVSIRSLIDTTYVKWGAIDALIANAGLGFGGTAAATSSADFTRAFEYNVVNNNIMAQHAFEHLKAAHGSAVFVSSASALAPSPTVAAYGASKRALLYLMQSLALDWGPHDVRVNALVPGLTRTEPTSYMWRDEARLREHTRRWPLARIAEPIEQAAAALFLASSAASYITGHALVSDGGRTLVTANSLLPEPDGHTH